MVVDHLNDVIIQIGDIANLAHLNADGNLDGHLKIFLLSCKVAGLSPRSIDDYSQKIGSFIRFCYQLNINHPDEVTINHVRLFLLKVQQRCKPISVHDYYGNVNRFFNWLVQKGILEQNPMSRMRPPRVPKELIAPFKPEHINNLLKLCDDSFIGVRNRAIILAFLDTGLRLYELANIKLADIDMDREIIKVMGKGAKERLVRIGKETQKAILRYLLRRRDNLPCLWVKEEFRPMHKLGIQTMIKRLGKRAGLDNVRCSPHTFRHSFGTYSLNLGADIREVQSLLGHSTLTMTMKYVSTVNSENAIIGHRRFSPVDRLLK